MTLSVLIAARNEEFLNRTVRDVLDHARGDTSIIVVLDCAWPTEPLLPDPRVQVVKLAESIGQRAAINLAARLATTDYICKLDAHCSVAEGFDVALMTAAEELGPDVTQVPSQWNLHVFDWVCDACGNRRDQGPTPPECVVCHQGTMTKEIVWKGRRLTEAWRFDQELRFGYFGDWKDRPAQKDQPIIDTMSCLGACWFLRRDRFWALGGLDEAHGSWGQMGTELACKAWLSGGRLVTNRTTWYAHMFRTQGGDFGFPYPISHQAQEAARAYSREFWRSGTWPLQVRSLRWLVDHFWPVPGWSEEDRNGLLPAHDAARERVGSGHRSGAVQQHQAQDREAGAGRAITRGIVYYSDNRLDPEIAEASRRTIEASGLPIVAVTLQPIAWRAARTIVLDAERGYLAMFRQILAGLEALNTDVVFFCEHDVLYSEAHFREAPDARGRLLYNQHVFKVDAESGRALHYRCSQTSGLVGDRQLLIAHYRKRIALVEAHGFSRAMGFEPGTHNRPERVDDLKAETWMSSVPNIDIRHSTNLTPSRWSRDQFRNQKYTEGWTEADAVPGWGTTKGRMREFLAELCPREAVA